MASSSASSRFERLDPKNVAKEKQNLTKEKLRNKQLYFEAIQSRALDENGESAFQFIVDNISENSLKKICEKFDINVNLRTCFIS